MPPKLAFLLCTAGVLFFLRIDRRKSPELSYILWIPTLWMLVVASRPLVSWTPHYHDIQIEAGSALDRLFLFVLLGLGLFVLALSFVHRSRVAVDWSAFARKNIWLLLLLLYMFTSIFWSEIPFISFKRWSRELIAVVMALLLLTEVSSRQAFESLCRRTIYILIPFSILLIKYFPEYGRQYDPWSGGVMWVGVTLQKNGLGRLSLISVFFLVWSLMRRKQGRDVNSVKYENLVDVIALLMSLMLLKGPTLKAYSATAVGALAAGLAVYWFLLSMKKRRTRIPKIPFATLMGTGIVFGVITVFVGGTTMRSLTSSLGRDITLTGRTEIWASLLPEAMKRPLLGHGFGGFWTTKTRIIFDITEAHNGYLDVLLGTGFVGLILFSMFVISTCRRAQKELNVDFDWAALTICFFLIAVLHNVAETSFNSLADHLTAMLLFLAVSSTRTTLTAEKPPEP